jgi:hypothetical protein
MQAPRVRFTIKRMIIGVAVTALLLWCSLMIPRVTVYRQMLAISVADEAQFRRARIFTEARSVRLASEGKMEQSQRLHKSANKHRLMEIRASEIRKKYERAMGCPWIPLPPDPPPPVDSL